MSLIEPGELLLSSDARGVESRTLDVIPHRAEEALDPELVPTLMQPLRASHRRDRVYVTPLLRVARLFAQGGGTVYEVEPIGDLEEDPSEPRGASYSCESARVLHAAEDDVPVLVRDVLLRAMLAERLCGRPVFTATHYLRLAELLFWSLVRRIPRREGIHGQRHWERVLENAFLIALRTPEADPFVLAAFAALHDACRASDGRDPEHGERAAELARELAADVLCLFEQQLELLYEALSEHDRGRVTANPTIGACWDADRLDLPRVGIEVDPRLLSTAVAVALLRKA